MNTTCKDGFIDKSFTGKVDKIFGHLCNVVTEDGLKMLIEVRDILKVTGWSLLEGRKRLDGSVDPSSLWWVNS